MESPFKTRQFKTIQLKAGQSNDRKRFCGFSLVEAAIVLGIVGLIIAGVWLASAAVFESMRVSRTGQQVQASVQAIRTLYSATRRMGNTDTSSVALVLARARVFMAEMTPDYTSLPDHAWAIDSVDVFPASSPDANSFRLVLLNIPASACVQLAVRLTSESEGVNLLAIRASNSVTNAPATAANISGELTATPVSAQAACGADPSGRASLSFTFGL